jgi:hypothetical protein
MRLLTSASIGVLSLLLAVSAVVAQDDAKPRPAEPEPQATHPEEAKPAQEPNANQGTKDDAAKPSKQDKQLEKQQAKQEKEQAKQDKQNPQASQVNAQNGGMQNGKPAQGGRIPEDQFKAHFGRQHTVVINQPVIVEGQPRFQYSGYWFVISEPWPAGWAYTDQCYIDYVDGEYVLFDLLHPGVQITLFVVL